MTNVQVLTSEGCTPCLRVKRILKEIQLEIPNVAVEEVDFASPTGSKMAIQNNIAYPPALFIDGKLVAKGKIYAEQVVAAIGAENGSES
jgi:glutaredoxin